MGGSLRREVETGWLRQREGGEWVAVWREAGE